MARRSAAKRGTRKSMARSAPKIARRRGSAIALSTQTGGVASFARGGGHGPSIKKPDTYEALRRKGMSKRKAAAISNAQHNGTIDHHGGRRGRGR